MSQFLSVGIDIGTTTTHLVISRLTFSNRSRPSQAPNLAITAREIVHESPVYLTPLNTDETGQTFIDAAAVAALIKENYQSIKAEIATGALIITGESARARNAPAIIEQLAEIAGAFVCESAGPNMESLLAARGSQAVDYSRLTGKTLLNIDIGGGTSNYALIKDGNVTATAALNIGGRCLEFAADSNEIRRSSAVGRTLLNECLGPEGGEQLTQPQIRQIARRMAELILMCARGEECPFMLTETINSSAQSQCQFDEIVLSGGVASLMQAIDQGDSENFQEKVGNPYQDMGQALAMALNEALVSASIPFSIAPRPIRATVIGAGQHSMQLSGSTVGMDLELLPLRNLKLIRLNVLDEIQEQLTIRCRNREIDICKENVALYIDIDQSYTRFNKLNDLAQRLTDAFLNLHGREPMVLICKPDLAMALSLLIAEKKSGIKLIAVDGLDGEQGDYVDIGLPLSDSDDPNTRSLPIVIKTLVFYKSAD